MGNIVSAIGSDIDSVVESVGKLVTDVSAAVAQLTSIAEGFAPKGADVYVVTLQDANDIDGALKNAMTGASSAASALFTSTWPSLTAAGVDNGVVQDYVAGGSVQCVVDQVTSDFTDWEIDADSKTAKEMANTIAQNVKAQMGTAGSAQGHYSINMNQQIDWTVAYGLFAIGSGKSGLVYAYTAAFSSGF